MKFSNIRLRLSEAPIRVLLADAVGEPTEPGLSEIVGSYRTEPNRFAFGWVRDADVLALLGGELASRTTSEIRERPSPWRRMVRLNRDVVNCCSGLAKLRLSELYAETDADARDFYQQCGFSVSSLGERYPGVERFSCLWRAI